MPITKLVNFKLDEILLLRYQTAAKAKGQPLAEYIRRALATAYNVRAVTENDICDYCAEPGHQDTDEIPCINKELMRREAQNQYEKPQPIPELPPPPPPKEVVEWDDLDCDVCLKTGHWPGPADKCPKCQGVGYRRVRK